MDITIYSDAQTNQVRELAELTRDGKISWICTEYYPLSFMLGDDLENTGPYISQMFTLETERSGTSYELVLSESIDLQSGKGDIVISLEQDGPTDPGQYDDGLSFDFDRYDECPAENLWDTFRNHPAVLFSTVVPMVLSSKAVTETFEWASYVNENGIGTRLKKHPLFRLGEKLFREHNLLAFHRCVLDIEYRRQLLDEIV